MLLFAGCKATHKNSSNSIWSTIPTDKTSKIKVVTTFYKNYEGLHAHCIEILTKLHYEIASSGNPITTKPRTIYNGKPAKYSITCHDSDIVISGVYGKLSVGGLGWAAVVKGKDPIGTPWFEKMKVFAEATKGGTIYYSDK